MPHCAVCVEPPCLEPLLDQPYQCAVINALRQHPEYPLMVDVVEEPGEVRFDHPVVSAKLQLDRSCVDRIKGTNMGPIAITTAQEVLRVDGRE